MSIHLEERGRVHIIPIQFTETLRFSVSSAQIINLVEKRAG